MAIQSNKRLIDSRRCVCCLMLLSLVIGAGCRINLPSQTYSNLWARAVEDRADWHLCNIQQQSNSTHQARAMSDWTKGYYRGYHDAAFAVNQLPASRYPAVWSDKRNKHNSDEQTIQAGYNAGFQQASYDGLINSVPLKR